MDKTTISIIKKAINQKSKPLPILHGAIFTGDYLITTDLEHAVRVAYKSEKQGVVENFEAVLDSPQLFDQMMIATLEDAPELPDVSGGEYRPLKDLDKILAAGKTISNDVTRPNLGYVRILDGRLMATDGYSLYYSKTVNGNMWIDKTVLNILRLGKKLTWEYKVVNDTLCLKSGEVEVFAKQLDSAYPECDKILRKTPFENFVDIDTKRLKSDLRKLNSAYFAIVDHKVYAFPNYENGSNGLPDVKSAVEIACTSEALRNSQTETRRVFLPTTCTVKVEGNEGKLISFAIFERIADPISTVAYDFNYMEVL